MMATETAMTCHVVNETARAVSLVTANARGIDRASVVDSTR